MCVDEVAKKYIKTLKSEINRWGGALSRPADTVYFGGGTPSVLGAQALVELLKEVKNSFSVSNDTEITLEINPEDASETFLKTVKDAGFNRLSIGFQSLNDETLKLLGRRHDAKACINAFELARKVGFDNVSVDLMLSLPNSSISDSLKSAKEIIALSPEHISCYMLILEEKTALYSWQNRLEFPSEEEVTTEYKLVCEEFEKAGYSQYEISNFSKAQRESKHNLKYWRTEEYIGIGPSAYSFVDGKRFHYENDLKGFINSPVTEDDGLGGDLFEYVMLALRLKEGLSENKIEELFNKKYSLKFIKTAEKLKENGLLDFKDGCISLTKEGMLLSNSVIIEFMEEDMYENL